jgi:hypothetical protein
MMEGVNSTILRTFVNVTMYPQHNNNKKKITIHFLVFLNLLSKIPELKTVANPST